LFAIRVLLMPEIVTDPISPRCSSAASGIGIEESQAGDPDPSPPLTCDGGGRFAKGRSGNPRGRPRGIRNPRRRVPNLVARPLSAQALSDLLDRKPYLLRPLVEQLLPLRRAAIDPAEHLGIDLNSLCTVEDCRRVLSVVLAAVAGGKIAPAEGAGIARRVGCRLSAMRRLQRLERRASESLGAPQTGKSE
jgi:hypothetical protein